MTAPFQRRRRARRRVMGVRFGPDGGRPGGVVTSTPIPGAPPDWDVAVTYQIGQQVTYNDAGYESAIADNLGNTPGGAEWTAL